MERSGVARVGLDDLLLHITGNITFSQFRNQDEEIRKGDLLAEIIQEGKRLKIYSPVTGKIVEINSQLNENIGNLHDDPYGKGWIYKIKPSNWIAETQACHFGEEAIAFSNKELERFKDFLARTSKNYSAETAMIIMQDGGEICDHSLSALPEEIWNGFQEEFLNQNQIDLPVN
jgi:glycine cleavage system H protein